MNYRLVAVSGKFGGNRRLPTGKVNPGRDSVREPPLNDGWLATASPTFSSQMTQTLVCLPT